MRQIRITYTLFTLIICGGIFSPCPALATQMHAGSEGILVHQLGHLFFLISMVTLIFTINGQGLDRERGWRQIQFSAALFIVWNLDAMAVHFLDNQISAVDVKTLSVWAINIDPVNGSKALANFYYILKLDHLLCVPAIFLFFQGLSSLLKKEET
ncbi:hypothetical protein HRM2_12090 [Desulforapulum autotrophicum HRM2]|uniref:Uncharacterized protein n=1 Tax=Desulforapulum autotrophicum (strain ATCC 43914 / DSM 3382 / VKM B-1955 / HRM2) TaxID=177437 RepID=C0QM15_DESAH|nr:hypothetical protein [Desulforapulum autotrophicum]ACN14321.1 hypothetical protein HRM2_12090 [Desulforapulum autotrophicum HRM2]